LILDKGQRDGVRVGQAVIDETGLLGQVVQVMPGLAQVMLITDAGHAVPLVNERSGQQFVAEGIGDRQQLSVRFISPSTNVQIGDVLITSGLGRRFPRGYPVGEIVSITPIEGDAFVDVRLAISAKPESVDHALVLFLSEGSQKIDIDIQAIDQAGSL
jgi:rod shape-determining protein MreC